MKKIWSRFIPVSALGCLLAWVSLPAMAYSPPLQTTATIGPDGNGITLTANDPQAGTVSVTYPDFRHVDYSQKDGIVVWESRASLSDGSTGFQVSYAIYDSFLKTFKVETQGVFLQPGQISIADGVVGFIPWVVPTMEREFRYSTYDPAKGAWQNRSWSSSPGGVSNSNAYAFNIYTKDGVVLCQYIWEIAGGNAPQYEVDADIYDASSGRWSSEVSGFPEVVYVDTWEYTSFIKDATIYITWGYTDLMPNQEFIRGYDAWNKSWSPDPTKPMAWFVAQPTTGNSPLWVWFTDMSIGGATVDWWFGDGATSTKRSDYHTYTNDGFYMSQQQIKGTGTDVHNKGIYVGIPAPWGQVYAKMVSGENLTLLRQYRDEVLNRSDQGKNFITQVYDNSGAAFNVLLGHPELLAKARSLIQTNQGAVIRVLQGREGIIYNPEEVLAFLQPFGEKAPPRLRALINVLQKEMCKSQREGKPFLGFKLHYRAQPDKRDSVVIHGVKINENCKNS